jgi:hypothetical protein
MDRKKIGLDFFRIVWLRIAEKVIDAAIKVYNLDEKQSEALKKAYLKPNHYYAMIR